MVRLFTQLDVNTRGSLEEFELIRDLEATRAAGVY